MRLLPALCWAPSRPPAPRGRLPRAASTYPLTLTTTTMYETCVVPNCTAPRIGRSNKCNRHRLALRRHGHPLQTSIKAAELEPYRAAVCGLWKTNLDASLWQVMQARWCRCIDHAQRMMAQRTQGVPHDRHEARAAEALLALNAGVDFQAVACRALALFLYAADRPQRFADDQGFRFQLVRKVRALDDLAVGKTWNHQTRTMHRVYRDMAPRAVRAIAIYLEAAFAEAGLLLRDHPKAKPQPRLEVTEGKLMAESVRALR